MRCRCVRPWGRVGERQRKQHVTDLHVEHVGRAADDVATQNLAQVLPGVHNHVRLAEGKRVVIHRELGHDARQLVDLRARGWEPKVEVKAASVWASRRTHQERSTATQKKRLRVSTY